MKTMGVVIHSTRGGAATPADELRATIAWFENPASQVSAHAIISVKGVIVHMVDPERDCWGAREFNSSHLQIELVQSRPTQSYTDEQYKSCAWLVKEWAQRYGFPLDRAHIRGHDEIPPGLREGKTDPGKMWDWQKFMDMLGG